MANPLLRSHMPMSKLHGFVALWKPVGLTTRVLSNVLLALTQHRLRIGHVGTLDPLAEGVVPLALGNATRLIPYMPDATKVYAATLKFGIQTDEDDTTGSIILHKPVSGAVTEVGAVNFLHKVKQLARESFTGKIKQRPPMHSAVRVGGARAYALARSPSAVAQPALAEKDVEVHHWTFTDSLGCIACAYPEVMCEISCGPGVYIRSLARDLGAALNEPCTLATLTRNRSGSFTRANSHPLYTIRRSKIEECMVPADAPFTELPAVFLCNRANLFTHPFRPEVNTTPTEANACMKAWIHSKKYPVEATVYSLLPAPASTRMRTRNSSVVRVYMLATPDYAGHMPRCEPSLLQECASHGVHPIFLGLACAEKPFTAVGEAVKVHKEVTMVDGDFEFRWRTNANTAADVSASVPIIEPLVSDIADDVASKVVAV